MSSWIDELKAQADAMKKAYSELSARNPESPLLRLIVLQPNGEGWVHSNEFWAKYHPEDHKTIAGIYAAYARDLEKEIRDYTQS